MRSDFGKKHKKSDMQKLKELQVKAERRRLDGITPTRTQIRAMVRRTRKNITPMQSMRILDEITRNMLPGKIE